MWTGSIEEPLSASESLLQPPVFAFSVTRDPCANRDSAKAPLHTVYLGRALDTLRRRGGDMSDALLAHAAPLGRRHVNFTGDYLWSAGEALGPDGFRPLRGGAKPAPTTPDVHTLSSLGRSQPPPYGVTPYRRMRRVDGR